MAAYKVYRTSKVHPILLLVIFGLFLFIFIRIVRGLIGLLALLTPVLLVATVILNYKVIIGYGKWLISSLKSNPVFGVLAIAFTIMAFPLVAAYLLLKAINSRSGGVEPTKRIKGEYITYEEVEEDFLDLSDVKNKKKDIEDRYNDLIE